MMYSVRTPLKYQLCCYLLVTVSGAIQKIFETEPADAVGVVGEGAGFDVEDTLPNSQQKNVPTGLPHDRLLF